jgi:deoxyribodipyrimidine photo-lyase
MSNKNTNKLDIFDYGIFIFRKDFRIYDNRGLNMLIKNSKEIIPVFIFDPYQVDLNKKNMNYLSFPALRFICESIIDLNDEIIKKTKSKSELNVFYGNPIKVIEYIVDIIKKTSKTTNISIAVGFNADFTSYSLSRDKNITDYCIQNNIKTIICYDDNVLCDMELLVKEDKTPYKQYGAFKKNMLENISKFNKPINISNINFVDKKKFLFKKKLNNEEINEFWNEHLDKLVNDYKPLEIGCRKIAIDVLRDLKKFKDYGVKRDILSYETTHLSAYLNFGLVSEREFYWAIMEKLGKSSQLINQVIWREYYLCLLRFLEKANSYDEHIDPRYNKIKWVHTNNLVTKNSKTWKEWDKMMNSQTGFLLVDAAIQELLHTGFMHNRCRMIVGVFAVKYLCINPLCRYIGLNDWFSRHLLDCSTSQNKLNTQWISELDFPGKKFSPSDAPIAGRPMNISNSMIKKWDPNCIYIKKWLKHLSNVDNKILYGWDTKYDEKLHPKPMFDPKLRYKQWIDLCKK